MLFHTQQDKGNLKNKVESKEMGLRFFTMYFDGWISFILSQNAIDILRKQISKVKLSVHGQMH